MATALPDIKICMYNNGIASNSIITDNFTKIHERIHVHKIKYIMMTLNNLTHPSVGVVLILTVHNLLYTPTIELF